MIRNLFIIVYTLLVCLFSPTTNAQIWYGGDGPIPLLVDSSRVAVRYEDGLSLFAQQTIEMAVGRFSGTLADAHVTDGFRVYQLGDSNGYYGFLDSLAAIDGIELAEPYYLAQDSQPFLVGTDFCVGFDSMLSSGQIDAINAAYHVRVVREMDGMHNVFILRNTKATGLRMLDLANA